MTRAYLDHASTTPPRPEALAALTRWMALPAADPGRLHEEGRTVRDALEEARQQVAALVGATPRQVVFTSGGTEAINAAVWGATRRSTRARRCSSPTSSTRRYARHRPGWRRPRSCPSMPRRASTVGVAGESRLALHHTAAAGTGALPVGQPRGGDAAAGARDRGAVPGRRRSRPRRRRGRVRPRSDGP